MTHAYFQFVVVAHLNLDGNSFALIFYYYQCAFHTSNRTFSLVSCSSVKLHQAPQITRYYSFKECKWTNEVLVQVADGRSFHLIFESDYEIMSVSSQLHDCHYFIHFLLVFFTAIIDFWCWIHHVSILLTILILSRCISAFPWLLTQLHSIYFSKISINH